jgi:hypothetical protein
MHPSRSAFPPPRETEWRDLVNQCRTHIATSKAQGPTTSNIREMWNNNDCAAWERELVRYWAFLKPSNLALEREIDGLDVSSVKLMNPEQWYRFLLEKYFRWKFTAPNRYASTTMHLKKYSANNELRMLHGIRERIFADAGRDAVRKSLESASSIRGLGTAGASGLLAILFPSQFGTVDQFLVKALAQIPELPERQLIAGMKPESLTISEGVILIGIMRRKAQELNKACSTTAWTPRKVDMVLWTCGH